MSGIDMAEDADGLSDWQNSDGKFWYDEQK